MNTQEMLQGVKNYIDTQDAGLIFDISEANAESGVLATYDDLSKALGTGGANVPASVRDGGMSVKFIQQLYTVAKTTSSSAPSGGTPINSDPGIGNGSAYTAADLSAFSSLPTTSSVVYYLSDGESTPTYTIWTISKNAIASCSYVQWRYMGTSTSTGFTTITNWQGVTSEIKSGSKDLVESGAIAEELALGAVYDVSAKHPTAGPNNDGKFTLEYILNNANTLIPTAVRKPGMSIKFAHSVDNKYVQYRLMSETFNTTPANWQGVDDEPTAVSPNLANSYGVWKKLIKLVGFGTDGSAAGVTESGQTYFNTSSKLLRYANGGIAPENYITIPFVDGAIYTYNNELYVYNGTDLVVTTKTLDKKVETLEIKLIKLTGLGADAVSGGITAIGQTYYNTSTKLLRYAKTGISGADFVTVPYVDAAIYTCNNELYVWNGTDLVKTTADIENKLSQVQTDINEIKAELTQDYNVLQVLGNANCTINNEGIKATDGTALSFNYWKRTGFLPVPQDATSLILTIPVSASSFGIAFYTSESENSFIGGSGIIYSSQNNQKYDIPQDAAYIRFCKQADNDVSIKICKETLFSKVSKNNGEIDKLNININTLDFESHVGRKVLLSQNGTILLAGASFAESANGWFELACQQLGVTGINKAVGGTSIMTMANSMAAGTMWTQEQFDTMDVLVIFHAHNKNVFDGGELENNSEDYTTPFDTSDTSDANYCRAFDYVLKKYQKMCYDERNNSDSQWYNTYHGKPFQVVFCTHWHDARTVYNDAIRKLSAKWGIPLVTFDDNIGFSKYRPYTDGTQISVWYAHVGMQQASWTEVIDGVTYGWHPDRGQSQYIQKRMAAIFINTIRN